MKEPGYAKPTPAIISELVRICGPEAVIHDQEKILDKYARDQVAGDAWAHRPEVVVKPADANEIAAILRLANCERIAVTPRAGGSGLSGGAVPVHGGIVLSVERLNRILEIDTANLMAVVEPGVITNRLDAALREYGLFFAGYPMSEEFCFVGGNVAENAGGGRAVKYGVTGRYIQGLEVVMPTGEIVQFGGKRVKDVTGYDMVSLMVGSEGTLGIFTRIFIRLLPRPTHRMALLALFKTVETAIATVPAVMITGRLIPSAIEFMDALSFSQTVRALKEDFPCEGVGAALLFEVDGHHESTVRQDLDAIARVCRDNGCREAYGAEGSEQIERFWRIRKQIPWVLKRMSAHQSIEDIVVPIAAIPAALAAIRDIAVRYDLQIPVFGHAGDGNLHATPIKNPAQSPQAWEAMLPGLLTEIYTTVAGLGGTISGEHGIGHKRKSYMPLVMTIAELEILRGIKKALDPNLILNPGKILPP